MIESILKLLTAIFAIIPLLTLCACSGYHFKTEKNPFAQYNIRSVSVPLFQNRSNLPALSAPFTRAIAFELSRYDDLSVTTGENFKNDAILLGILQSADRLAGTRASSGELIIQNDDLIGNRTEFPVKRRSTIKLALQLILIKNPTHQDIEFLLSPLGHLQYHHPKVIFGQTLSVSGSYSHEIGTTPIESNVNFTKNLGAEQETIQDLATSAATQFRELILYAF